MNQTLRDIEIICVNDGSTDGSGAILDEYAAKDGRFSVIHQENAGQAAARNNALRSAKGEYVLFVDSDDLLAKTACQIAYEKAKASDADLVHFQYSAFGETSYDFSPEPVLYGNWTSAQDKIKMERLIPSLWQHLFRREFLLINNISFPEKQKFEDIAFVYIARYLANIIVECPDTLYRYRVGSGCTTSFNQEKSYLDMPKGYNRMIESLISLGADKSLQQILLIRKLNEVFFAWTIKKRIRKEFSRCIANSLLPEERRIIFEENDLDKKVQLFYKSVSSGFMFRIYYSIRFRLFNLWDWFVERLYYRSSLYKKHENEVQWLKTVIENHDEFFKSRE